MEQVALINVGAVWKRVLLLLPVTAVLWGAWHGVRWGVGATMAETAPDLETAAAAERLAPRDPTTHLRLARLHRASFLPEELPKALAEYERAAALAPNDYLIWTELGRARGAAGDYEGGAAALRRATELAPGYAQPRWHLGNVLLRAGHADEAFAELRRAADADPALRPQVFNLAWQVYNQNIARVMDAVSKTPGGRAQLAVVLVGRGQLENALAVWSSLSAAERREHGGAGEAIARALYDRRQYRQALQVLGEAGGAEAAAEKIRNGSFESEIAQAGKRLFDWQVTPPPPGARVAIDPRAARGGSRSLQVSFNAPTHVDFKHVAQVVGVEPSARYRLSFFVRTEELKTASTLLAVVTDGAPEETMLGASPAAPTGTNEWQEVAFEFTTGPRTEAVALRLVRANCADGGGCPAYGKIWYDDFDLQRAAGRGTGAR